MTKKDYELIASAVNELKNFYDKWNDEQLSQEPSQYLQGINRGKHIAMQDISEYLATALEVINPKFNRNKFLQACGIQANLMAGTQHWTIESYDRTSKAIKKQLNS